MVRRFAVLLSLAFIPTACGSSTVLRTPTPMPTTGIVTGDLEICGGIPAPTAPTSYVAGSVMLLWSRNPASTRNAYSVNGRRLDNHGRSRHLPVRPPARNVHPDGYHVIWHTY